MWARVPVMPGGYAVTLTQPNYGAEIWFGSDICRDGACRGRVVRGRRWTNREDLLHAIDVLWRRVEHRTT
jgi:hypothetical protein